MYKKVILNRENLIKYLEKNKIKMKKSGKIVMLECPFCKKDPMSANIIPNTAILNCFSCNQKYNLLDIAKKIEQKFPEEEEEQLQYLKTLLNIEVITKKDEEKIEEILNVYVENGFDLVPIMRNGKAPIEKDWTNKSHKDKNEWLEWIRNGFNIGVKGGLKSNLTIIDIDQKPIPEEIKKLMGNTLTQESTHGFHLFYKFEEDLPKTRIDELKIDIETTGGQVVIYPSIINNIQRKIDIRPISKMPEALKKYLKSKIDLPNLKTFSEKIREDIKTENFKIKPEDFKLKNNNLEGCCNSSFIKLGGILRKELNTKNTEFVLNLLNTHLLEYPMEQKAIRAMVRELDKYTEFDEQELAYKVLQYMRDAEDATRTDVQRALEEKKIKIDKVLNYLVREGCLIKRGRNYHIIKKANWKYSLVNVAKRVPFKVPYFYDVGNFNYGDLILIGSKNKKGKTHVAMNIIKQFVKQGIKPYYISLETGSRFTEIALQLGLKEDDFAWDEIADPTKIELEPNAVTVIDWLLVVDKSKTDLIFRHFVEQLHKTNGFLIIFQQLKGTKDQNNQWFAPNMAMQFPSLATRYLYEDEDEGTYGKFVIDAIRDPKKHGKKMWEIPCVYNWQTKELKRKDELEDEKIKEDIKDKEKK